MFGSVICLHLSAVFSVCGAFIQVDPANQQLVDVEGRQRYFHGVNVVVKEPPWIPVDSSYTFTDKDMATLQELGLNALRLVATCGKVLHTQTCTHTHTHARTHTHTHTHARTHTHTHTHKQLPCPPILTHRLGMMWPGVEPERGKYNFTYLEVARNLTKQ